MTWAEFCIRSFAFNRQREWEQQLFREVSYEVFTLKYLFSKSKPPSKSKYWQITDEDRGRKQIDVSEEMIADFMEAWKEYDKKRKENE